MCVDSFFFIARFFSYALKLVMSTPSWNRVIVHLTLSPPTNTQLDVRPAPKRGFINLPTQDALLLAGKTATFLQENNRKRQVTRASQEIQCSACGIFFLQKFAYLEHACCNTNAKIVPWKKS